MRPVFHTLTIANINRFGDFAIAVRFAVPEELRAAFKFAPGQYLTLRATIEGHDVRRPYSICTAPFEDEIGVGIKLVEGGLFSQYALREFVVGDQIEVMTPQGRFTYLPDAQYEDILLLAAGSGITPILSIARTALEDQPDMNVTLIYGNRNAASIMFRAAVEDLKDQFLGRLRLIHILSREQRDIALLNGRVDGAKIDALVAAGLVAPKTTSAAYLCGPDSMISECLDALTGSGLNKDSIFFERFTPAGDAGLREAPTSKSSMAPTPTNQVEVMLDGATQRFGINPLAETVLSAGQRAGLELPYSCAAGMCCTCRCRVVEGSVRMDANFSLEDWEIEAGFVLSCQARPETEHLIVDFDAQ